MPEMIRVNHMTKDYGEGRGIFDFDFKVMKGETVGIVGTNGSGKTTTLRHLMGFLAPDKGYCEIMGLNSRTHASEIMKNIGYVPGEIDFPDVGTGTAFLKLQAEYLGIKDLSYMNELIDRFKIDTSAPLKRMSKGMKQKMALVAAFMGKPDVLLLDEPSTGLDPLMRDTLIEIILEEKRRGATILLSSHIFKELEDTCDRVVFIESGKMIDVIGREIYNSKLPKLYRIGFAKKSEYEDFLKTTSFKIDRSNDDYNHAVVKVPMSEMNHFIKKLSDYNMRYMRYIPYTLEMYYSKLVEKGEILNV